MENRQHLLTGVLAICLSWQVEGPVSAESIYEKYARHDRAAPQAVEADTRALGALLDEAIEDALLSIPDLPGDATAEIETLTDGPRDAVLVESFDYEPWSGRFTAVIVDARNTRSVMRGRAPVTAPAYMPLRRVDAGEILVEADIGVFHLPLASLKHNVLRDPSDMVGKEVRRALLPERPVRARSLIEPRSVHKGSPVLISLSGDGLDLTAPGKSLQDGATGQVIRVVNTHSNTVLHAEVVGDGRVRVGGPPSSPSNN